MSLTNHDQAQAISLRLSLAQFYCLRAQPFFMCYWPALAWYDHNCHNTNHNVMKNHNCCEKPQLSWKTTTLMVCLGEWNCSCELFLDRSLWSIYIPGIEFPKSYWKNHDHLWFSSFFDMWLGMSENPQIQIVRFVGWPVQPRGPLKVYTQSTQIWRFWWIPQLWLPGKDNIFYLQKFSFYIYRSQHFIKHIHHS